MEAININHLSEAARTMHSLAPEIFKPINNEIDNDNAISSLRLLMKAIGEDVNHPLELFAQILAERIQAFEDSYYIHPDNDPAANLRYALEQRGISGHTLAKETGIEQATISRLCTGNREFTAEHIRVFAEYFKKDPSLFLGM